MTLPITSRVTGGLFPVDSTFGPTVTQGGADNLNQTPVLNPIEDPKQAILSTNQGLTQDQINNLRSGGTASLGAGYQIGFDPNTLQGRITPALNPNPLLGGTNLLGNHYTSYTGADVRLMISLVDPPPNSRPYIKQLIEATTITVSVHREVAPVRAGGYINPKGFALGKRTIAGTLILTQFTVDALYNFLQSANITDGSKDTTFTKVDQLPPFNITMLFTNEYGFASQRDLLGVKFVTDGTVYSIQDMMTEQTLSYMAMDYTPLLPVTLDNLFTHPSPQDRTIKHETSPFNLMQRV